METNTSFYSQEELQQFGFKHIGTNVLLSKNAKIYGASNIFIGDNVRIDDFCILSGNIIFGNNIHISAYCALYGANTIEFKDYTNCSARSIVYSAIDDFSGDYLVGPMQPNTNVTGGKVTIEKFGFIGAGSIIFPNLTIAEGSVVGAMSLLKKDTEPWMVYAGIPCRKIKARSDKCKKLIN